METGHLIQSVLKIVNSIEPLYVIVLTISLSCACKWHNRQSHSTLTQHHGLDRYNLCLQFKTRFNINKYSVMDHGQPLIHELFGTDQVTQARYNSKHWIDLGFNQVWQHGSSTSGTSQLLMNQFIYDSPTYSLSVGN